MKLFSSWVTKIIIDDEKVGGWEVVAPVEVLIMSSSLIAKNSKMWLNEHKKTFECFRCIFSDSINFFSAMTAQVLTKCSLHNFHSPSCPTRSAIDRAAASRRKVSGDSSSANKKVFPYLKYFSYKRIIHGMMAAATCVHNMCDSFSFYIKKTKKLTPVILNFLIIKSVNRKMSGCEVFVQVFCMPIKWVSS